MRLGPKRIVIGSLVSGCLFVTLFASCSETGNQPGPIVGTGPIVDSGPIVGSGSIVAGGASFSEPKGWSRGTPNKPKTKGYFLSPDSNPRVALNAIIMIDVGEPAEPSLQATAEKTARDWGGKLLDETTTLDGVEALRVRVETSGPGLRPLEGVLAMKDGKLYMLMGGALPGRSVIEPVEEVRKGWKWVD